jgi:hypothetical protein
MTCHTRLANKTTFSGMENHAANMQALSIAAETAAGTTERKRNVE